MACRIYSDIKSSDICRTCLSALENYRISLFQSVGQVYLYEHVNLIANVNIKMDDGLPPNICSNCFSVLDILIGFKKRCEKSNSTLQDHFWQQSDKSIKLSQTSLFKGSKVELKELEIKLEPDERSTIETNNDEDDIVSNQNLTSDYLKGKQLQCDDCGELFKSKCKISVHWKNVHMCEKMFCDRCKRYFKSFKALHRHQKTKACLIAESDIIIIEGIGKGRTFTCRECDYKTKLIINMDAHIRRHTGEKPYQCKLCAKTYTQISSLIGHRQSAHNELVKDHTCKICSKIFISKARLRAHSRTHMVNKVNCEICNKSLQKTSLHTHMKHHADKLLTCELCATSHYTLGALISHKRTFHKIKAQLYACKQCAYKSYRKRTMLRHEQKHDSNNNHLCDVCGKCLNTASKLEKHKLYHVLKTKECPYCPAKYHTQKSLRNHVKRKHETSE